MMGYYHTTHVFEFSNVPADALDEWTDVMVEELESTDVRDVSVGGSLAEGHLSGTAERGRYALSG